MTQKEFEDRTGMKVNANEFDRVHDIYMACGDDVDKDEFCKLYRSGSGRLELLHRVTEEKMTAERSSDLMAKMTNRMKDGLLAEKYAMAEFLVGKACAYEDTDFHREAVRLVGHAAVTFMKLRMDLPLWDEDKRFLRKHFEDGEFRQVTESLERAKAEKDTEAERLQ